MEHRATLHTDQPFTIAEAVSAGLTRKVVRRLVGQGLVRPVMHGVFVDAGVQDTVKLRAAALTKVAPPDSIVCDRAAAWLHGVDILAEHDPLWLPPLDVFRADGDGLRREGCVRGKRALNLAHDTHHVDGVLATTPLRTACDLARLCRRPDAFVALNALAAFGGFSRFDLYSEAGRFKGMRGVVQLRSLAPHIEPLVESPAESVVLLQLIDAGLPIPEAQFSITNQIGIEMYRLDFAYPSILLAVEYDGEAYHSSPEQRERDRRRRQYLRDRGWMILVLRKHDVFGSNAQTAALVKAAVAEASQRMAG